MPTRGRAVECQSYTLAAPARHDGIYARRTTQHFDRSRASGPLRDRAYCLTRRSARVSGLPIATLCLAKFRTRFVRLSVSGGVEHF